MFSSFLAGKITDIMVWMNEVMTKMFEWTDGGQMTETIIN